MGNLIKIREVVVYMDTPLDIERQRLADYQERNHQAVQSMCESCLEHNNKCPYYSSEEESWDYDTCFKERGF